MSIDICVFAVVDLETNSSICMMNIRRGWSSSGRLPTLTTIHLKKGAVSIRRSLQLHLWKSLGKSIGHLSKDSKNSNNNNKDGVATSEEADWLEYGAAELNRRRRSHRPVRYSVETEFLQPTGWISRTPDGKFVVDSAPGIRSSASFDTGRFFKYSPVIPVVESGVYRIGGDRMDKPRPEPILRRELVNPVNEELQSPQFGRHCIATERSVLAMRRDFRSSSPGPGLLSPSFANISDMSSVRQPSSVERSFPTTLISSRLSSQTNTPQDFNRFFPNTMALSSSVSQSRYIRELPALLPVHEQLRERPNLAQVRTRAEIHSETPRKSFQKRNEFALVLNNAGRHIHEPPPYRPPPTPAFHHNPYTIAYPPLATMGLSQPPLATSSPPRSRHHVSRSGEEALRRRRSPLTIAVRLSPGAGRRSLHRTNNAYRNGIIEYSPQSQSSSSGFDSKNTSQQNQSSQSGSGSGQSQLMLDSSSAWTCSPRRSSAMEAHYVNWPPKVSTPSALSILDASVDNHYEFDTTLSPDENRTDSSSANYIANGVAVVSERPVVVDVGSAGSVLTSRHKRTTARYENIEARVQAMKEEFHEYRKRRARGMLESAC